MPLPVHLRTFITGTTAVTQYIGTRCHYAHIPQASARSHVWFRVASDNEELTLDGGGGMHSAIVDLECVATSAGAAQSAADAVKTRLHGYKGAMGSVTCAAAFVEDKDDDYVPYANRSDDGVSVVAYSVRVYYTT